MNAFTPAEPEPCDVSTFNHAAFHELESGVPDAQRYDGWTPEKQKRFLTALARGHNVTKACAIVGMSRQTAYALRDSAGGAGSALGWKVARLRARYPREGAKARRTKGLGSRRGAEIAEMFRHCAASGALNRAAYRRTGR